MKFFNVEKGAELADIYIYGTIGWEVNVNEFVIALKEAEKEYKKINIHLNTPGGSIYDGVAMINAITSCKSDITMYIDGIAASMGSVIAACGKKVIMSRYATLMIHRPSGWCDGDSEKMREVADQLDQLQTTITEVYAARTRRSAEDISSEWFKRGQDTYFSAQEALDAGLIDEIYDGIAVDIDKSAAKNSSQLWSMYSKNFNSNQNQPEMKKSAQFVAALAKAGVNVSAEADEDQLLLAVHNVVENNVKLAADLQKANDTLAAMKKSEITALLDAAVSAGKITAAERPIYEASAEKDIASVKAVLDAKPVYKPVSSQLSNAAENNDARKDWTFADWHKKDPAGLQNMKSSDPEKFRALYKAKYGTEPK